MKAAAPELAELLARYLAEHPIPENIFIPVPVREVNASRVDRRDIVQGSFRCDGPVDNRAVILVDDVATTGSTLSACAAALKAAGAASVWGLILAREI